MFLLGFNQIFLEPEYSRIFSCEVSPKTARMCACMYACILVCVCVCKSVYLFMYLCVFVLKEILSVLVSPNNIELPGSKTCK